MEHTDKNAILVVSFGTSYRETRIKTIDAIEKDVRDYFHEYEVRHAYTSGTIIRKLMERDGLKIDNVHQALERLKREGYKRVVIQPTHVINGIEYDDMREAAVFFEPCFERISFGKPLLSSKEDFQEMVRILTKETQARARSETCFVFMGHGTKHIANAAYVSLEQGLKDGGFKNCMVGAMEAAPSFEDVAAQLEQYGAKQVVLMPLLIVAGDHTVKDMAGDHESSWKSRLESLGYQVTCMIKGLGEYKCIRDMFVEHTKIAAGQSTRVTK